jgi:transposase
VLRELSVAEQRYQAVLAVIEDGLSVTEAAAKVGVSRQTLHGWLGRYAAGGLEGLADRSHRPVSCPHQMDAAVEVRLVELRQLHPGWGPDRLRYRLGREGCDRLPSRAAISRALVLLGLVSARRARQRRREYRRWERGRPTSISAWPTSGIRTSRSPGIAHQRDCRVPGLMQLDEGDARGSSKGSKPAADVPCTEFPR